MDLRPPPANEDAVLRFVEELWLPYHRELERTVDRHSLADNVDLVSEEAEHRLERLQTDTHRIWIAVDTSGDDESQSDQVLANTEADLVGFITTDSEEAPTVFDQPDQLVIGDIYVRPSHRGTGLSRDLIERAKTRAQEEGCSELALDVDLDNERAVAFYEKIGFEPYRLRMALKIEDG